MGKVTNRKQALAGMKVVEYGDFISAPYCAKLMAELGAEVIKVEPPQGDSSRRHGPFLGNIPHPERSGLYLYQNTSKLGVTLNLDTSRGQQILQELIKDADVFVENMLPQHSKELRIDYDTLSQVNQNLIVASITPFGQTGKYSRYKAQAINIAAVSGLSSIIGKPDREPLSYPLSLEHYQNGAITAFAVLAALFSRRKIGKGQHIDVSETDCLAALYGGQALSSFVFHQRKRIRTGHRVPGFYPYTFLPCKDGFVSLIAVQGFQWKAFLQIVGDGEVPEWYASDPRFKDRWACGAQHADALDALLAPWLMSHTKEEIFTLCREKHVPFAPARTIGEVANDSHLKERAYFVDIDHAETGKIKYPGAPYKLPQTPWRVSRPAPLLGEHNGEVYCQRLGYSRQDLSDFRRAGII